MADVAAAGSRACGRSPAHRRPGLQLRRLGCSTHLRFFSEAASTGNGKFFEPPLRPKRRKPWQASSALGHEDHECRDADACQAQQHPAPASPTPGAGCGIHQEHELGAGDRGRGPGHTVQPWHRLAVRPAIGRPNPFVGPLLLFPLAQVR